MFMHSNEFEEKFDAFLENKSYDLASEALFHVVRAAFTAGWKAAGGPPTEQYHFSDEHASRRSHIVHLKEP